MDATIIIKLPPLLADELEYSVDNWLNDQAADKTPAEESFGRKVEADSRKLALTHDEAVALYNELWNMEDKVAEWANGGDPDDIRWFGVHRSIMAKLDLLRGFGIETDVRGWAVA